MLLDDLPPDLPLLLIATADVPADELDLEAARLFNSASRLELGPPSADQRHAMFKVITCCLVSSH